MSLKAYDAFKLRDPNRFWEAVNLISQKGKAGVVKAVTALYDKAGWGEGHDDQFREEYEFAKKNEYMLGQLGPDVFKEWAISAAVLQATHSFLRKQYKESSLSNYRDFFDFNASVALWQFDGQVYLRHFSGCGCPKVFNFMKRETDMFQEYHYQNQTDKPSSISNKDWDERAKVWEAIADSDYLDKQVVIEICSYDKWWQIDPYLAISKKKSQEFRKKAKKLGIVAPVGGTPG